MSSAHTARCPARPFKLRNPVVPTRTDRPDLEVQGDLRTHQIAFARNADCSTQSSGRRQHDRAVFHFLIQREDRERYVDALHRALLPGGHAIIATFGPSGPERCSGLPIRRYDSNTLAAELRSDFELVDSSLVVHRTPARAKQQFLHCWFKRRHGKSSNDA